MASSNFILDDAMEMPGKSGEDQVLQESSLEILDDEVVSCDEDGIKIEAG